MFQYRVGYKKTPALLNDLTGNSHMIQILLFASFPLEAHCEGYNKSITATTDEQSSMQLQYQESSLRQELDGSLLHLRQLQYALGQSFKL